MKCLHYMDFQFEWVTSLPKNGSEYEIKRVDDFKLESIENHEKSIMKNIADIAQEGKDMKPGEALTKINVLEFG